jgi:hypothetical protein
MLLGELHYLLHPILVQGLYGILANIPLAKLICGADGKLERVNLSELKQPNALGNQPRYICCYIWYKADISLCSDDVKEKEEAKIQTISEEYSIQWRLGSSVDVH